VPLGVSADGGGFFRGQSGREVMMGLFVDGDG